MCSWQLQSLSKIGTFSKGAGISKDSIQSEGLNAVRYGELYTDYNVFVKNIRSYISEKTASEATVIQKGDILFAGSGETIDEIGKSAVYTLDTPGYAGGDIIIFRPDNQNDSLFLAHILNSSAARKGLRRLGQGQSIVHIYKGELEKLKLNIPEKPEQERIVSVLEAWDEFLELLDKNIALKEQLKNGLVQQLLMGKKRPLEFSGKWDKLSLGEICKIATGKKDVNEGNPNGQYPFFSCSRNSTFSDSFSFDTEAILVAGNGDVGHCKYYYGKFEAYQRTYVLSNFSKTTARYIYPFMQYYFQNFINSQKQMGAMPYIKLDMLKEYQVILPNSTDEQNAIMVIINNSSEELLGLYRKKKYILSQKKYLLNNLITGKILTPENLSLKGVN